MDEKTDKISIVITTGTIIKIVLILILFFFLFIIRDIILVFFIALIFASAFNPWVESLQKKHIPRAIGILSIYLILIAAASLAIYSLVPLITEQIGDLAGKYPDYISAVTSGFSRFGTEPAGLEPASGVQGGLQSIGGSLQSNLFNLLDMAKNIFGGVVSFFLIFVITFYMAMEENAMSKLVRSIAPAKYQLYILSLISRMQKKIGLWMRGQIILCAAVGVLTYVGLSIMGVKYALVLALIAGFTEFVPYLGPILGSIPAVFLAFSQAPLLGLFTAIFYYFVQLTENHILVPKVMQKTVGLNPIVSIIMLLIGFKLAGIAGAVLSIPLATAASVLVEDLFENRAGYGEEDMPEGGG